MDHQKNLNVELNDAHSLSLLIFLVEIIIYMHTGIICACRIRETRAKKLIRIRWWKKLLASGRNLVVT